MEELKLLEKEAEELQSKIDNSNDWFFIYGWVNRLEEIKAKITDLTPHKSK